MKENPGPSRVAGPARCRSGSRGGRGELGPLVSGLDVLEDRPVGMAGDEPGNPGSTALIRQARRRNTAAIRAGRVRLIHAPVESLSISHGPFNAALSVNTVGMWPDPSARLHELARLLRPGGRIALVSQPRCPGATAATSAAAASELASLLTEAGFEQTRARTGRLSRDGTVRSGTSWVRCRNYARTGWSI